MVRALTLLFILLFLSQAKAQSQNDTVDYFSLSFEDLMNVTIVSASKKEEDLFSSPLSASVLTRDDIQRAGATSIMEALRLVPGVIVRELTNGNYDIHIRGLDNVPPNSLRLHSMATTCLVMVNNRPVYNYMQGGIFWETLSVHLNDVERIEVIRGPSSTLYGPNAVSGVVNIIVRETSRDGFSAWGDIQYGSLASTVGNASVGYQVDDKFSVVLSGNYQNRGRDERYLDFYTNEWVEDIKDLTVSNPGAYYPHPGKSMIAYGANALIGYHPKDQVNFHFSAGLQDSEVQTANFDSDASNINTFRSSTHYFDLRAVVHGFSSQVSYNTGYQSPIVGFRGNGFDFSVSDITLEYELKVKSIALKPGFTYRGAIYDDTERWDASRKEGTLNGRRYMETFGGTLRSEYTFWKDRIRTTGGVRVDKFTYPDDVFFSYQAASNIKLKTSLFRIVYSKAYRSPFIYDTYQDLRLAFPMGTDPETFLQVEMIGNKSLKLLSSTMFEIGYRSKLSNHFSLDVESYIITTKDYTGNVVTGPTRETPSDFPIVASFTTQSLNIPAWTRQGGLTVSLSYGNPRLQLRPFFTLQRTELHDYSEYSNTDDVSPTPQNNFDPSQHNIYSGIGSRDNHKFTPSLYGGLIANYEYGRFNFNLNSYYFTKHTFYHQDNILYGDGIRGVEHVKGKVIVNAKIQFSAAKYLSIYLNARNLTHQTSVEYYRTDQIPFMLFGGIHFSF